jgi:hypothetical protein
MHWDDSGTMTVGELGPIRAYSTYKAAAVVGKVGLSEA